MYGLLLTLVLTQAGAAEPPRNESSAVVLVERTVGLSPESAQALATEVSGLFEKEGIPIVVAPEQVEQRLNTLGEPTASSCEGRRPCLMRRGQALGATMIVLLKAQERTDTLTINLEAVAVEDGTSLVKDLFLVTVGSSEELTVGTVAFAQSLNPLPSRRPSQPLTRPWLLPPARARPGWSLPRSHGKPSGSPSRPRLLPASARGHSCMPPEAARSWRWEPR
jgi:hypothetical protein